MSSPLGTPMPMTLLIPHGFKPNYTLDPRGLQAAGVEVLLAGADDDADRAAASGNEHLRTPSRSIGSLSGFPSTNDTPVCASDPGPTPAANSLAPVLGIGQGTKSAFISPNLIYQVHCPTDEKHPTFGRTG